MPRPRLWSPAAVRELASTQHDLVTAAQLAELKVPRSTVSRSDDVGGMFTFVLPGVHRVDGRGPLSEIQRGQAALLYAGAHSLLTGLTVLRHGAVRAADRGAMASLDRVHVLVPHAVRRSSHGFVRVERTVAMPRWRESDGLRLAALPRAVLDAVRQCTDEDSVRAVIFEVVQRGLVTAESLEHERLHGQIRGSRFPRLALDEVLSGVRSVPEGDVRRAFLAEGRGDLLYNPRLHLPDGRFLACPDVYDRSGVCLEIDSREHHFAVDQWEATMQRHSDMTAAGLAVLHVAPRRFWLDPRATVATFGDAVATRTGWPAPDLVVVPADPRLRSVDGAA
jgi:hypothetical protein